MKSSLPKNTLITSFQGGFTLLETLVALSLFVVVVVPLFSYLTANSGTVKLQNMVTAQGLLNQQVALVREYPDGQPEHKNILVGIDKWQISIIKSDTGLVLFTISASKHNKKISEVYLYVNTVP